jgi:hypothetical protein
MLAFLCAAGRRPSKDKIESAVINRGSEAVMISGIGCELLP